MHETLVEAFGKVHMEIDNIELKIAPELKTFDDQVAQQ